MCQQQAWDFAEEGGGDAAESVGPDSRGKRVTKELPSAASLGKALLSGYMSDDGDGWETWPSSRGFWFTSP